MPKYEYTALDLKNKKIKGILDARDEDDLNRALRMQELVPVSSKEMEESRSRYRLKAMEVSRFSRQIANMLSSGMTIVRALDILKERDAKPVLRRIFEQLYRDVQQGFTLSEGMRMQGNAFPTLLINMYAAGEASGHIDRSAEKMANHYEKDHRLNGKVRTAMVYPCILVAVIIAAIMLLFTMILPSFFGIFAEMNATLPPLTVMMMDISAYMQSKWYVVLLVMLAVVVVIRLLLRVEVIAFQYDKMKVKLPIIGKLLVIIYTARFARTLSSLYSSGLTMLEALEITTTIVGNKYICKQFEPMITNVRNGIPLSEAIAQVHGLEKKLSSSILIGEESGKLDVILDSMAEGYDYEADEATSRLVQLIEPVMLILMAGIVLVIAMSVMMPLMSLYGSIG